MDTPASDVNGVEDYLLNENIKGGTHIENRTSEGRQWQNNEELQKRAEGQSLYMELSTNHYNIRRSKRHNAGELLVSYGYR